jgi:nitroreductase
MLLKKFTLLALNYTFDATRFIKHSSVFTINTQQKIEGKINYYYHSIEKGLINEQIRYKFGALKINKLIHLLKIWLDRNYDISNSQFIAACSVLVKYYHLHNENKIDISAILAESDYHLFEPYYDENVGGTINYNKTKYFQHSSGKFDLFSDSRHSVRHFNGVMVSPEKIEEVIKIAKNAPSVCNRQSVNIKLVNSPDLTQQVLRIQNWMSATANTVNKLILVTSNLNSFVSEVERNQMFIDGGIFLQNVLYALHYHKIAACPLNWSKPFFYDKRLRKLLKLNPSDRVIAVVAIGYPPDEFKVPFSKRKEISEILEIFG